MQLIKKLGTRKTGNSITSVGLFKCSFCSQIVERCLGNGNKAKSCGCKHAFFNGLAHRKHGLSHLRLYGVWLNMIRRCHLVQDGGYKNYGGRGIIVCEEWKNNFAVFQKWAKSHGYNDTLEIDRENNNGNYTPFNCRFITHEQNQQNKRTTKLNWKKVKEIRQKYSTKKYSCQQLALQYGVCRSHVFFIIKNRKWIEK